MREPRSEPQVPSPIGMALLLLSSRAKPRDLLFAARRELADYGELAEEVYIALECGEPENQVRARLLEKLKSLATS